MVPDSYDIVIGSKQNLAKLKVHWLFFSPRLTPVAISATREFPTAYSLGIECCRTVLNISTGNMVIGLAKPFTIAPSNGYHANPTATLHRCSKL